jgi:hypothetical protein
MRTIYAVLVPAVLVSAANAPAQNVPRFEVFGDYSLVASHPVVSGATSSFFNGGGGGAQVNFGRYVAFKADLQGYGSALWSGTWTNGLTPTPHGVTASGLTYTSEAKLFSYVFGPAFTYRADKFTVFAECLAGASNTTGFLDLQKAVASNSGALPGGGTQHPFTMALGGGLDLNVHRHLAIRLAQLDYLMIRHTNPLTSNDQNNLRFSSGIVVRFGGE